METKKDLLALVGPTAVGKTALSIDLAKKINGEIISSDSMQIYKYMDIGTAKIRKEEMEDIPHYLIDIVYPDEEFTVADYKYNAEKYINEINNAGKMPIIVGGTGLYLNSLVYELKFTRVEPNEKFRKKYNEIADIHGNQYLFEKLCKVDEISAKRINPNDRKRIIRALEIYYETGKPMSYYNKDFRKEVDKYNLAMIGLTMDRTTLYSRINKRVDMMIIEGLVEEVNKLLAMGYNKELVSMQGIGYKEIIWYLEGNLSLNEAIEILKRNTRRFAKRQLTWFKRDDRIYWININHYNSIADVSSHIIKYINKFCNLNI
ncbi:tRNA isopentenylpyrophosphate transferase [[Clostridium] ultunense Esp]|uniref:tRNA dimethylallyltransferase n=1 Tax=[Clostridium] ultunense Esp TaxID=1288971 RepID=M1YRA0_9FIRM|nr:tRNA (adenosine(37)-N6)-dimethylallyltransferase MiaA [Schnuerera ultunensis]CCQ93090.1 tRNA isopentenylpyrophosphate transferase [[Clostridium] ultunense Esp]SHD77096.1 tRNA isopentenylpyrophosphate transferase [[Clostridium] ultunense Esp]